MLEIRIRKLKGLYNKLIGAYEVERDPQLQQNYYDAAGIVQRLIINTECQKERLEHFETLVIQ